MKCSALFAHGVCDLAHVVKRAEPLEAEAVGVLTLTYCSGQTCPVLTFDSRGGKR